ncbi:hypothetical protein SASPL_105145 [Salvia splendens]|uniref:MULE transposase domain-containing protein n=1 Tax=Salvia splendens TaxID=180675 RepID=A0A8X8YP09_SALSN|nr:hypothetical protein SASPL_105145 [Salvia splendens]
MDETISQGIIPKIGMEFETEVEAYDVYMKYAKATGFGTRKKTVYKDPITVDVAQSSGLRPKKIVDVMAKEVGGIQHLDFTHIDLKNYLRTKRTLEIKQDAIMGKRPKTTLTDQDQAMSAALASKWLSTYHRLCVWHIFQNAAIHLSSVFSSFKNTFAADFSRCVYDFEEESEFLDAWNEIEELRKAFESKIESENQLGRKAVESEDSYTYAIDCLLTMGNDIDGMAGKTNNVTVEANKQMVYKVGEVILSEKVILGTFIGRYGFDPEKFGYFDIEEEVKNWALCHGLRYVNCYPSESEESDNELIDTELFDENDSVVKEKNIVVYDDIAKLLDGCVGHDDNENIFRLCKLWQQCGIHVTIDLFTDSPSDFVDTDSRRSVRGAPGSTGQSLPSESHFGRCHTPAISAASSLSISSDCCGLRGLVVDMTLEFMVELGQVVDMTLALVLVMVEQEGELTEAEQVIVAVVDTILIQDRCLLSILKEFSHFSWLLLLATRS